MNLTRWSARAGDIRAYSVSQAAAAFASIAPSR
jgi:hypothetical protein